jgi:tetratricopeptide (TPR) repeat protein
MVLDLTIEEQERARELFQIVRRAYEMLTSLKAKPLTHIAWAEGVPMRESPYAYSIEEYLLLARANPSNTAVLFNLAWKFFEQNMLQEALDAYERVLTINPDDIDAAYNLRVVYLYKEFDLDPDLG